MAWKGYILKTDVVEMAGIFENFKFLYGFVIKDKKIRRDKVAWDYHYLSGK